MLTIREGAFAIGPHLRQEFRGLRSVYTENMAGDKSPPDVMVIVLISYNVVFLGVANKPPCHAFEGALNAISMRVKCG
jgi:hypothetical protein